LARRLHWSSLAKVTDRKVQAAATENDNATRRLNRESLVCPKGVFPCPL
jgi:hypothetical protein